MELLDSRRLTGANAVFDRSGAVIDVAAAAGDDLAAAIAAWQKHARRMLDRLGWGAHPTAVRRCDGGASLALAAPIDALYAATDINEWAWQTATGAPAEGFEAAAARLAGLIAAERNPALLALAAAAGERDLVLLSDDDSASVGLGSGSRTWPVADLPDPRRIDWPALHNIPVALITGTNGKTTSARLAAAIARTAGRHVGLSSTEGLAVDGELVQSGDFAGPGGARATLRHPAVEMAFLETARGGLLRRGLGVPRASAALITRIARDHLGDFGSRNLAELLDIKWVVTRALNDSGRLVLNADDPLLVERAAVAPAPVIYFSLDAASPVVARHVASGGNAWVLRGDELGSLDAGGWQPLLHAGDMPLTLGGAARFNIGNALGVAALCACLGIERNVIAAGLQTFDPQDNPGRGNLHEVDGVRVLVDFAHNPDAFRAIVDLAQRLPARRRLIAFGEAGDRTDTLIRDLASIAWRLQPDRVITLEIPQYARGREPGEIRELLHAQLRAEGAGETQLGHHHSEVGALTDALDWARPGDLVILLSLAERDAVNDYLEARRRH